MVAQTVSSEHCLVLLVNLMTMRDEFSKRAGLSASAILATLTILIFVVLQNYGPESVVRRFHRAAVADDLSSLAQTVLGDPTEAATVALKETVRGLAQSGYRYEFQRLERLDRRVFAYVSYHPPRPGPELIIRWVVDKPRRRWEINSNLSYRPVLPMPGQPNRG